MNLNFSFSFNSTLIFSLIFGFSFSFYALFLFDTGLYQHRTETGENVEEVEYDRPLVRCESVKDKPQYT